MPGPDFNNDPTPPTAPIPISPPPPGYPMAGPPGYPPPGHPQQYPPQYPPAYPMPPAPKKRPAALLVSIGAAVIVVAAVLVTGLAWPGWLTGAKPQNTAAQNTATQNTTTQHPTTTRTDACRLVPTSDFEQAVGADRLTPKELTPIRDPVSGTLGYLCAYTDASGTVLADIEVADYPASVDAHQLLQGVASTGTDLEPVEGIGTVAGTLSDLGKSDNRGIIVISSSPSAQHVIVIAMITDADPSVDKLTQLARTALNAG